MKCMMKLYNNSMVSSKAFFCTLMLMMPIKGFPGDSISLGDAVNIYVYNTKYIKTERLKYENALLEYENHQKSSTCTVEKN